MAMEECTATPTILMMRRSRRAPPSESQEVQEAQGRVVLVLLWLGLPVGSSVRACVRQCTASALCTCKARLCGPALPSCCCCLSSACSSLVRVALW